VISFGMTAVTVMMALGAFLEAGHDKIEMTDEATTGEDVR
jgi:multicomponent K+:H+ antiporter subunit C